MNYYKRHLGDYAKDTRTLSTYEHGVYNLLLDLYYTEEAAISSADALAVCRPENAKERAAVSRVLSRFFVQEGDLWRNHRADEEIAKYQAKSDKNKAIGHLGGVAKSKRNASETLSETLSETPEERLANDPPSHKPIANSQEKANAPDGAVVSALLPDWVPRESWDGYVLMRAKLRKPLTERGKALAIAELDKLRQQGQAPGAVLDQSVLHSWQGLFPLKEANTAKNGVHIGKQDYAAGWGT